MLNVRVCALCGKNQRQGQSLVAATLLVKWSKDAAIRLVAPDSSYLDPRCAARLKKLLRDDGTAK